MKTRLLHGIVTVCLLWCACTASKTTGAQAPPIDLSKFVPLMARAGDGDYIIGPPYANAPELTPAR